MRRIVIACTKGGVGKTATTLALASELAGRGHRVLAIDVDSQANLTWALLGGAAPATPTLADVLTRRAAIEDAIRPTSIPNVDLVPADAALGGANIALAQELGRDTRLRSALATVEGRYDFALTDTGPTFTSLMANALVASTEVIVPVDPCVWAAMGFVSIQSIVEEVREAYGNAGLHVAGLLLTRVPRTALARDVEAELRGRFGELVFRATIPAAAAVAAAHSRAIPITVHDPRSPASAAYRDLTEELIAHGSGAQGGDGVAVQRGAGAGDAAA
jgi:chromosome partitioning protein